MSVGEFFVGLITRRRIGAVILARWLGIALYRTHELPAVLLSELEILLYYFCFVLPSFFFACFGFGPRPTYPRP
jgi:hypothetical protein